MSTTVTLTEAQALLIQQLLVDDMADASPSSRGEVSLYQTTLTALRVHISSNFTSALVLTDAQASLIKSKLREAAPAVKTTTTTTTVLTTLKATTK